MSRTSLRPMRQHRCLVNHVDIRHSSNIPKQNDAVYKPYKLTQGEIRTSDIYLPFNVFE